MPFLPTRILQHQARRVACAVTVACVLSVSCGAAQAQSVYRSGTDNSGGEAVNCYTNAGAAKFRKHVVRRDGVIRNSQDDSGLSARPVYEPAPVSLPVYPSSTDANGVTTRRAGNVDIAAVIQREARRNGIDPLLVESIIQQESGFDPYATSPSGAQGLMQLMPGTAAGLGVTDPYDVEQNVAAGVYYFASHLKRFNDLSLALAAYNAGPGAVESYGGVPPYSETQNYVAIISGNYAARRKQRGRALGG